MKKLLFVKSVITGEDSQSAKLASAIIERIKKKEDGNIRIVEKDLVHNPPAHLGPKHLKAFSARREDLDEEHLALLDWSDKAVDELFETDYVVVTAPMYNLAIPSNLKTWIDNLNRAGKTFKYSEAGAEGLIKDKKVYVAISTGGVYSEAPLKELDHTESYLKAMFNFLGMTDVKTFRLEGAAIPGIKETALEKAISSIKL